MHENKNIGAKSDGVISEKENTFTMLAQRIVGDDQFSPTEKQVDEILAQKRQVYEYIHEDKKRESGDNRFYFGWFLFVALSVTVLVLIFAKEYLTQVLSMIFGALGGYGFGKSQKF